jgi:signal recognition particle receptor subunit beta
MNPLGAGRRFLGKIEIDGKMMFLALQHSTYAAEDAMTDGNVTRAVMIVDYTYPSTVQSATHMERFRKGVLPPIVCHLNKPDDYTIQSESDLSTIMNDAMTSAKVYQPPVTDGDKEAVSEHEKDI